MTIGEQRRFECSLTVEERRDIEITLLVNGFEGFCLEDDKYLGILDSLIMRGLLIKRGIWYRTTEMGKSALGRAIYSEDLK